MRKQSNQIFTVSQNNLADSDLSSLLHHFTQQRVRLLRYRTVWSSVIRRIVERRRNFRAIYKPDDVHRFGSFDLDLGDVFGLDDRITIRLVLITLGDLVVGHDLATLLAALVVADRPIVLAVQLIKLNLLGGLDRVIDANGYCYQQEPDMAFPDGSHCEVSGVVFGRVSTAESGHRTSLGL